MERMLLSSEMTRLRRDAQYLQYVTHITRQPSDLPQTAYQSARLQANDCDFLLIDFGCMVPSRNFTNQAYILVPGVIIG